jgi:hypothetical protein
MTAHAPTAPTKLRMMKSEKSLFISVVYIKSHWRSIARAIAVIDVKINVTNEVI